MVEADKLHVIDPEHVREVYASGPVNVNLLEPCITLTFTTMRPGLVESMNATVATVTEHFAVVTGRIAMPIDVATMLHGTLGVVLEKYKIETTVPAGATRN